MAKEASTGQAEVLRQCENQSMDKTAQASRLERAMNLANAKIIHLEGMLGETKQHSEDATQLLSGSPSAVYSLEGEAMKLRDVISKQAEEMQHASMVHEDTKKTWTQLSEVNTPFRAQIVSMSAVQCLEQPDSSMRSSEDEGLRVEIAACLARGLALGHELQTTRFEVQQYVSETNAQRRSPVNEVQIMIEDTSDPQANSARSDHFSRQLETS